MTGLEERLYAILERIEKQGIRRDDVFKTIAFNPSTGKPVIYDRKERQYLYVSSPNTITITVEEYGNILCFANTWVMLPYLEGTRMYLASGASGQQVLACWTDYPFTLPFQPMPVAQTLSNSPLSATNPEPNISNIEQFILNGQAFSVTTDEITPGATEAGSLFFPSTNTKNIIIWSVRASYSNANQYLQERWLTANDTNITAGTNLTSNIINMKAGGAAPVSGVTLFINSAVPAPAASASNIPMDGGNTALNGVTELFAPGEFRYLPPGQAGGIAIYHHTTAVGQWVLTYRWVEF